MKNEIERSNTPLTFNWVEDSEHHHSQTKRPVNRPSSMVYYGPLTFEAHENERCQQNKGTPNSVPSSRKNSATVEDEPKTTVTTLPSSFEVLITTATLAFVVAIPLGVLGFFFLESSIQRMHDVLHSLRTTFAANAANTETVSFLNQTSSSITELWFTPLSAAILKYAKMAIWPFVLFIPSLFLFSHLIIGMTSENQSRDRKKMAWKVLLALVSLFVFMETMLAMASSGKWTLLGITSVFPLLMMILARLSIASAGMYDLSLTMLSPCGNHTVAAATIDPEESMAAQTPTVIATAIALATFFATIVFSCTLVEHKLTKKKKHGTRLSVVQRLFAALPISEAIILAKEWYSERSIVLFLSETFGFLFIFLPFIAGILHRILEPLFILSVPLSSLAICTIAGLSPVSLIGLVLSVLLAFIGTNILYVTLLLSYRMYTWLIHGHLALLLFSAWFAIFTVVLNESEAMTVAR